MTFETWLQTRLIAHGRPSAIGGADAIWGRAFIAALEAFQAARNLPVTGVADGATVAALRAVPPDRGAGRRRPPQRRPCRPGCRPGMARRAASWACGRSRALGTARPSWHRRGAWASRIPTTRRPGAGSSRRTASGSRCRTSRFRRTRWARGTGSVSGANSRSRRSAPSSSFRAPAQAGAATSASTPARARRHSR
jgi:Putative peptidoglycan binding domain